MQSHLTIEQRRERPEESRNPVADALEALLVDTYALYFTTQSFHWNVRGPHFPTLHALFESQYRELAEVVDTLAERLRALDVLAPTSLHRITERTRLEDLGAPNEEGMLEALRFEHEALARQARDVREVAAAAGDVVTEDLMVQRIAAHEKVLWVLRASLAPLG